MSIFKAIRKPARLWLLENVFAILSNADGNKSQEISIFRNYRKIQSRGHEIIPGYFTGNIVLRPPSCGLSTAPTRLQLVDHTKYTSW